MNNPKRERIIILKISILFHFFFLSWERRGKRRRVGFRGGGGGRGGGERGGGEG